MAKLVDVTGRPQSGVVPYAVVALVVDNDDPDERGRVKVKYPTLPGEVESYWLRQATPNAGLERGLYALPEVDDEVLVIFMQGSQDIGVIIGQFWNGVDLPPAEAVQGLDSQSRNLWSGDWSSDGYSAGSTDDEANDRRFWRSRSGHLIGFDDTDGAETIQIWDQSGELSLVFESAESRIILSNNKGDIHIRAKEKLFLEAGTDMKVKVGGDFKTEVTGKWDLKATGDIKTVTSGKSDHKATMDYKIKGMNFKAEGDMKAVVKGGMAATFEGGMKAELKSGGMTSVKGSVVMIN